MRLQKYDTEVHAGCLSISPLLADELLVSDHVQSGEVSKRWGKGMYVSLTLTHAVRKQQGRERWWMVSRGRGGCLLTFLFTFHTQMLVLEDCVVVVEEKAFTLTWVCYDKVG